MMESGLWVVGHWEWVVVCELWFVGCREERGLWSWLRKRGGGAGCRGVGCDNSGCCLSPSQFRFAFAFSVKERIGSQLSCKKI